MHRCVAEAPPAAWRAPTEAELAASFRAEMKAGTRETTLIAGTFALIGSPIWIIFDVTLMGSKAPSFIVARVLMEVALALCLAALYWRPLGDRWPEQLSLAAFFLLELGVCWMIPQAGEHLEAYLLGLSLTVFGASFLVIWRCQLAVALLAAIVTGIGTFSLIADPGLNAAQVTTCAFYLVTVGALSMTALVYRDRKFWEQYVTAADLEAERHRNLELLGELDRQSREDPLTKIANRRAWEERMADAWDDADGSANALALIVCDLDGFKQVNDELGHVAGDVVLKQVASVLSGCVRRTDFLARLGGDEFAILCLDTTAAQTAALALMVGDRVREATFPHGLTMTISVGVAERLGHGDEPADLYHRADQHLYAAKAGRRAVHNPSGAGDAPATPGRHGTASNARSVTDTGAHVGSDLRGPPGPISDRRADSRTGSDDCAGTGAGEIVLDARETRPVSA